MDCANGPGRVNIEYMLSSLFQDYHLKGLFKLCFEKEIAFWILRIFIRISWIEDKKKDSKRLLHNSESLIFNEIKLVWLFQLQNDPLLQNIETHSEFWRHIMWDI